tara:strand:+ start:884 stop:1162 length:279 start_codon:yes stop_codon:yes gene_type:complete
MKQYPIWNKTRSNAYKNSDKSHGANDYTKTDILIGTSSRNSHFFISHETRVFTDDNGGKKFEFLIDGVVVKQAYLYKDKKELTNVYTFWREK